MLYDPKYEEKSSDEIRSLRGLITKQTVCAGYSLMFKEMMDRLNIPCQYVEGRTENGTGHAWNLVTIDGKLYPVDVTFDNSRYQAGFDSTYYFLGQNVESFAKNHRPRSYEPVQDYRHTLSQINLDLIRQISSQFDRSKTYTNSTYLIARQDGSQFVISQVGNFIADGYKLNRYYYCDVLPDGTLKNPQIFFSESNVMGYKKNRDLVKRFLLVMAMFYLILFSLKKICKILLIGIRCFWEMLLKNLPAIIVKLYRAYLKSKSLMIC